jgi:hypothetical protein
MVKEHNPTIPDGSEKYFTNARGVNYITPMNKEWKKSGNLPRFPDNAVLALGFGEPSYDNSSIFMGASKTTMWWYYDSEENDIALGKLASVGMNNVRVFLDIYVWEADPVNHLANIDDFLKLCSKHRLRCQFVLWDGVHIDYNAMGLAYPEPTTRNSLYSIPAGLSNSWRRVPQAFEYSSIPQAENFYTERVVPYMEELGATVSGHQSMWSFDISNEMSDETARVFVSSTGEWINRNLSSVGIKTTIGNGAGYDPGSANLYNWSNGLSGSLNVFHTEMSSVLDFASIHIYGDTKCSNFRLLNEGKEGASTTKLPGMSSEGEQNIMFTPDLHNQVAQYNKVYGASTFGAFIEQSISNLAFLTVGGLFYPDGNVRNKNDVGAFLTNASSSNWFSHKQLDNSHAVKLDSVNDGYDGGFASGITHTYTRHSNNNVSTTNNYNPLHVWDERTSTGVSEDDWRMNRDLIYSRINTAASYYGGVHPNASVTFPPTRGKYNALGTDFAFIFGQDWSMSDIVDKLYALSSLPTLASFASEDSNIALNTQINYMISVLKLIILTTYPSALSNQVRYGTTNSTTWELIGTDWDYEIPAVTVASRYALSSAWEPLKNLSPGASSCAPFIDNQHLTQETFDYANMVCHQSSSCFYEGGEGVIGVAYPGASIGHDDIDWASYDNFFKILIDATIDCVNQSQTYANSPDDLNDSHYWPRSDYGLF